MGLMDKMKKILFDEEEVEVKEPSSIKKIIKKKEEPKETNSGFIDYHSNEEDTIKEVVIPKEEPVKKPEEPKAFNFTLDLDNYEPVRQTRVPDTNLDLEQHITGSRSLDSVSNFGTPVKNENKYLAKDYKKIISTMSNKEKKPFSVTPVISPVYGYIDEDYIKENEKKFKEKKAEENKQIYGPVSYIQDILPKTKKEVEEVEEQSLEVKEEIVEEPIVKEVVEEIVTPNYEEMPSLASESIEKEYIGNNNIEDAFEETADISIPLDEVPDINEEITEEEKQENEALADTIETDLFNLIDSMYKDEEEEND